MCEQIKFPEILEFRGSYDEYEGRLLNVYKRDLWDSGLKFGGLQVRPRVHQRFELNNKILDWTFVHITSKGDIEDERELDLRRCERMPWIKTIIENAHLDCIKVWENERTSKIGQAVKSVIIWCPCVNCKIVLTKLLHKHTETEYYVITTFYLIHSEHKIKKHEKEYEEYVKMHGEFHIGGK